MNHLHATVSKNMWDIPNDQFIEIVAGATNFVDAMRKCGYTNIGNSKTIKKRINQLNLSTDHFIKYIPVPKNKKLLSEILVNGSTYGNYELKKRLVSELNWTYECSECKLSNWNNKPITLELDHINGNNTDNRIENLRFLCPNCHSQTSTFRAKNKTKVIARTCTDCNIDIYKSNVSGYCRNCIGKYRGSITPNKPDLKTLENDLKELNYIAVGAKYGVSDNCIRKWIRKYNQETAPVVAPSTPDTDEDLEELKEMVAAFGLQ